MSEKHLGSVLKRLTPALKPRDSDSVGLGHGPGTCILTNSADAGAGCLQAHSQNHKRFAYLLLRMVSESQNGSLETESGEKLSGSQNLPSHMHEH